MLEIAAAIAKSVLYGAALSGAGVLLARTTLASSRAAVEGHARCVARVAGVTLTVTTFTVAWLLVTRLGGYWDPSTLAAIFLSWLGAALGMYLTGGATLAFAAGRTSDIFAASMIILGFAVSGHAAARGATLAAVMSIHVCVAAWWVGGLWLLLRASRSLEVAAFAILVRQFSRQAVWAVGLLLAAGTLGGAWLLEFRPDPGREYDLRLALKVALALSLLAVAARNRFALTPALLRDAAALPALRRSIVVELVLVGLILLATACLTTFSSPH
jgi:putative copper export protein